VCGIVEEFWNYLVFPIIIPAVLKNYLEFLKNSKRILEPSGFYGQNMKVFCKSLLPHRIPAVPDFLKN